jgi:hypothetical protein
MDRCEAYDLGYAIRGAALGQMPNIPEIHCTMLEGCELVAQHWASLGIHRTPRQIYEYSPSGELFMVFEWVRMSLSWQQRCRALPDLRGAS